MIRAGQRLREERLLKGLSLEDVSLGTKIRSSFLSAIEKGEYNKLPSSAYAQGFVRNYAEFLGLPKREVLALFRREFDEEKVFKVLPEGMARQDEFSRLPFRLHNTFILIVFLLILLAGFFLYQYRYAFVNPPLDVTSPKEGIIYGKEIIVSGKTDPNATIYVNNDPVTVSKDGSFMKQITVFSGKTGIIVKARNRLNRETIIERKITVRPSS
ncbi:MAG: helix-turn-helix domain-containing protein [Candidatus Levybacteria bacterium]|nr:helix-turn-helix domain-containing protein [Candidatus Levybacteria bacterium]